MLGHLRAGSWQFNAAPYPAANWDIEQPVVDPPTFCTCERCRQALRRLPSSRPTHRWTRRASKQYRQQGTDFRCEQNAQMAGKMRRW